MRLSNCESPPGTPTVTPGVQSTRRDDGISSDDDPPDDAKVAVIVVLADTVTTQVPVPEHDPPDHPENVEPEDADAVRVT